MQRDWNKIAARLIDEGPVPVSVAAKLLPASRQRKSGKGHAHPMMLIRWIMQGKRGVFLDGMRGPGKSWLTSKPAVARFMAALAADEEWRRKRSAKVVRDAVTDNDGADRERRANAAFSQWRERRRQNVSAARR